MKELGIDDLGRRMVLTDEGKLQLIVPTGQSATFSRRHIVQTIATAQADVDKWTAYLAVLDNASEQRGEGEE